MTPMPREVRVTLVAALKNERDRQGVRSTYGKPNAPELLRRCDEALAWLREQES